jgi:acid phosphatase type 7
MKPPFSHKCAVTLALLLILITGYSQTTIIPYASSWKYLDNDTRPAGWETSGFNDASWASGPGQLGYGDGDEGTVVACGSCNPKYITTYFRKSVTIANPALFSNFTLNVKRDDGVVVYINGTERYSNNMPAGRLHSTLATAAAADDGNTAQTATLSSAFFSSGTNVIAVEIHQNATTSTDITFDLELIGNDAFSTTLTRGPYLQMGGQTSLNVRWRTSAAQNSRVEIGTVYGTYTTIFSDGASVTEHEVQLTGLSPDTKYWYRIGNSTNMGAPDPDKFFRTNPTATPNRKLRFAVFGDCGRNDLNYRTLSIQHYQNYLATNSIDAADAWILLGDNAYTNGLDAEYTTGFFDPFQGNIMKNHKLYPAPGNHDYYGATQTSRTHAYYQNFTMPTAGQLGGVASGTEAYYSFDIGNVHFLSLDSYGIESPSNTRLYDTLGPQVTWIKDDLAANTKKWVIAYWHHPPYTMGSHNSNSEAELVNIRFNFIRILERLGVDLVLCGHSHDYERSRLLNGHYGTEIATGSMTPFLKSNSTGFYDGTANSCVYTTASNTQNHGTVYVVSGSAGADGGVNAGLDGYPHNALPHSVDDGGMLYLEVDDNRLDARFIRRDGVIADKFSILQDVNKTNTVSASVGVPVTLTASWPGNYSWNTSATTRSINITPASAGSTIYTVTDGLGCLSDQFTVNATGTLPVNITSFDAKLNSDKVYLNWSTAQETNNSYFTVERSANARDYDIVGTINSQGNSNTVKQYAFVDPSPLMGSSYYRLGQTDIDGHKNYYGIKQINYNPKTLMGVQVRPNGINSVLVLIESRFKGTAQLRIYDMSGREYNNETIILSAGTTTKELNLRAGLYICEVSNGSTESITQKILVQ